MLFNLKMNYIIDAQDQSMITCSTKTQSFNSYNQKVHIRKRETLFSVKIKQK